jgi:hypothetical protein
VAKTSAGVSNPRPVVRATSTTKTLLAYGVVAGPFYVAVSLAQALTRDGFDLGRHPWSLLSNGDLGWIQIANFMATGLMTLAFAVGLRRSLRPGKGATWAPRLVGAYGLSLVCAGAFVADPAQGFPAGTPPGQAAVSWHGMLHFVAGGIGFACLIAACFVLARRFATEGRRGWAACSRATGLVFGAAFAGIASGSPNALVNVAFVGAVLVAWSWVSAVALHLYRRTARGGN